MRDLRNLRKFWAHHLHTGLVLCTIVGKSGSGYRGLGAKKLVAHAGDSCGRLSGGCLDGAIVAAALDGARAFPFRETFSTMSEEDRLFGYQSGCAGTIDILFERIRADACIDDYLPFGADARFAAMAVSLEDESLGARHRLQSLPEASDAKTFVDPWRKPVHLALIGAGPHACVFESLAGNLGWDMRVLDYRADHAVDMQAAACAILPVADLGAQVPQGGHVAVVLATHNYEADLRIMAQLAGGHFGYFGCIGPRKRFEQMTQDLLRFHHVTLAPAWAASVKAPAGIFKGNTPEDIALSVVADIQMTLQAAS